MNDPLVMFVALVGTGVMAALVIVAGFTGHL